MANMELLVIDNALDHDFYRPLEHWSRAAGFSPASVHHPGGESLPDVDSFSHVIVSGSEDSITVRPPWAEEQTRWLAEAISAGCAVLGSCWGHQLLAVALAGPGAVARSRRAEFGWTELEVLGRGDLLPRGELSAFVSHFDEVKPNCHPDLRTLARSPHCAVQAMRWADLPVWGIQSHPEVDPATGKLFLEGAQAIWPEQGPVFQSGLDCPVQDSRWAKRLVSRFLASGPRAG